MSQLSTHQLSQTKTRSC